MTATGLSLSAGVQYWIVASAPSAVSWGQVATAAMPGYVSNGVVGITYHTVTPCAFSVQVTPVPEPATMAALGAGAVLLARRRKRL